MNKICSGFSPHLFYVGFAALLFAVLLFQYSPVSAQTSSTTQVVYNLQVHMLFKLLPYIDWTNQDDQPFIICILGQDPYGSVIDQLAKETKYKKRDIHIKRINKTELLQPCHVLFVNPDFKSEWKDIQTIIQPWQALTVSEYPSFAQQGGMINFFINNDNLNLEINVDAVEEAEIKINSQVLQLKKVKVIRK